MRYFIFHKPFNVLCQFSAEGDKITLAHFFPGIPKDVYPVGRLDYDSEGLLLLTDDKALTHQLLNPAFAHRRTYWVQVDGLITPEAVAKLRKGVQLNIDGRPYSTQKAEADMFTGEGPVVADRYPPVRYRKELPTSWLWLTLREGKNRQVRRMTAAVGFPTLRLIRHSIGVLTLDGLTPGGYKEVDGAALRQQLFAKGRGY